MHLTGNNDLLKLIKSRWKVFGRIQKQTMPIDSQSQKSDSIFFYKKLETNLVSATGA